MHVKILYRKALYVFLSVYLVIFSTPSFAQNPPPGGWKWDNARVTVEKDMQRIRLGVEAQKTYPVAIVDPKTNKITQNVLKAQKSAIKIAPTAAKVGKSLIKRAPNVAITNAVIAILGKSVDWVMDPENNRIKYKDDSSTGGATGNPAPSGKVWSTGANGGMTSPSADDLCQRTFSYFISIGHNVVKGGHSPVVKNVTATGASCHFTNSVGNSGLLDNFTLKPASQGGDEGDTGADSNIQYKYIPIDTVAQEVIDQANDGQAPALEVMSDTALDMLEAGELDSALDAAAEPKQYGENEYPPDAVPNPNPDTGTDPETPTDPENPNPNPNPEPTPWPAFCDWATLACDYYNWAMGAWEPPEGENNEVDIQQPDIGDWQSKANASYVQFDGQCPADVTIPINYMGAATNLSISYQPFCHFASMIKPAVILGAWISAMLIISGGRAKES